MNPLLKRCVVLLPLLLAACEDGAVRNTLGLNRPAPDEFTVVSRPPLSLPPEFTLRPPRPGEAPRGIATDEQARALLTGKPATQTRDAEALDAPATDTAVAPVLRNDTLSEGANRLLTRAGATTADESIRSKLTEDAATPPDTSTATSLVDALNGAEKNEPTVDAAKEAERLRSNKDAGKPVTEGAVPEEKPKKRSLIDRIF
ncbi:MAG: DUF3035 domain-containing protein [Alphaproteobacteria bacterium]|nr:DUF3035 domain-containing protein [Alphaproteobacteria bacterium]